MSEIQSDGVKIDDDATAIGRVEAGRQSRAAESDAASFEPEGSSAAPKVVGDYPAPPKEPAGPSLVQVRRREKKASRRNRKYEAIDSALREIAEARPKDHEEVFRVLENRRIPVANRQPFKGARGWLKGFKQNPHLARGWLSQTWGKLGLPTFARGPKK